MVDAVVPSWAAAILQSQAETLEQLERMKQQLGGMQQQQGTMKQQQGEMKQQQGGMKQQQGEMKQQQGGMQQQLGGMHQQLERMKQQLGGMQQQQGGMQQQQGGMQQQLGGMHQQLEKMNQQQGGMQQQLGGMQQQLVGIPHLMHAIFLNAERSQRKRVPLGKVLIPLSKENPGDGYALLHIVRPPLGRISDIPNPLDVIPEVGIQPAYISNGGCFPDNMASLYQLDHPVIYRLIQFYNNSFGILPEDNLEVRRRKFANFICD